jgi:preprotein translocase subunit SecA
VFEQRHDFMVADDLSEIIVEMRNDTIEDIVARHLPPKAYADQWDIEGLTEQAESLLGLQVPIKAWAAEEGIANEEIVKRLTEAANQRADEREVLISAEQTRQVEKNFLLQMIDMQWREHLLHLDHLRNVIGLRGYGQRDPLNEYKSEAFSLFETLIANLRQSVTKWMMTVEFRFQAPEPEPPQMYEIHMDPETGANERALESVGATLGGGESQTRAALPLAALPPGFESTGRNQPCPCGSGKKFKHCHGALV